MGHISEHKHILGGIWICIRLLVKKICWVWICIKIYQWMTTASGYVSIHIHHLYMLITGLNWITKRHWFKTGAATNSDNKSTSHQTHQYQNGFASVRASPFTPLQIWKHLDLLCCPHLCPLNGANNLVSLANYIHWNDLQIPLRDQQFWKILHLQVHFKLSSISGFGQPILTQTLKPNSLQVSTNIMIYSCKLQVAVCFCFVLFCGIVFATGWPKIEAVSKTSFNVLLRGCHSGKGSFQEKWPKFG